jgi:hypothetical protein
MICTKLPGKGRDRVFLRRHTNLKGEIFCCVQARKWDSGFDATEISDFHSNISFSIHAYYLFHPLWTEWHFDPFRYGVYRPP